MESSLEDGNLCGMPLLRVTSGNRRDGDLLKWAGEGGDGGGRLKHLGGVQGMWAGGGGGGLGPNYARMCVSNGEGYGSFFCFKGVK